MEYRYDITVRGFHCDLFGHVNNARYLEFLEEARWDFIEAAPELTRLGERGLAFIVAAINIEYRRPAGLGETLQIRSEMESFTAKRAVMRQDIFNRRTDKIVAAAQVTFAIIDQSTGRAVAMDDELRSWIDPGDRFGDLR